MTDFKDLTLTDVLAQIAKTLWAVAWADMVERLIDDEEEHDRYRAVFGEDIPSLRGAEITDLMPRVPICARVHAFSVWKKLRHANLHVPLLHRVNHLAWASQVEENALGLVHYLVMESLGAGVSWSDDPQHVPHRLNVPHIGAVYAFLDADASVQMEIG